MALLAEQLVDEWMNRQGFFTVRGIKGGNDEIDLLGVRPDQGHVSQLEAWHVEVQVSFKPNAYISKLTRARMLELGVTNANSAKRRTTVFLRSTVGDWVAKKFTCEKKKRMRDQCWPRLNWKFFLVHGNVISEDELSFIRGSGIELISFRKILKELHEFAGPIRGHAGSDLVDIVAFF